MPKTSIFLVLRGRDPQSAQGLRQKGWWYWCQLGQDNSLLLHQRLPQLQPQLQGQLLSPQEEVLGVLHLMVGFLILKGFIEMGSEGQEIAAKDRGVGGEETIPGQGGGVA